MSFYIAVEQNSTDKKEAISQLWLLLFFLVQQQKYIAVNNVNTFQKKSTTLQGTYKIRQINVLFIFDCSSG